MSGRRREALRPIQAQADQPFLVCTGEMTKEEKNHLVEIRHGYEDSQTSEFFDVSTMNESAFMDALEDLASPSPKKNTESRRNEDNIEDLSICGMKEKDEEVLESSVINGTFEVHEDSEEKSETFDVTREGGQTPNQFDSLIENKENLEVLKIEIPAGEDRQSTVGSEECPGSENKPALLAIKTHEETETVNKNETFETLHESVAEDVEAEDVNGKNGTFDITTEGEGAFATSVCFTVEEEEEDEMVKVVSSAASVVDILALDESVKNATFEIDFEEENSPKDLELMEESTEKKDDTYEITNGDNGNLDSTVEEQSSVLEYTQQQVDEAGADFVPESQPIFSFEEEETVSAMKLPEIPTVNVEEFLEKELLESLQSDEEQIVDKENMTPGRKEYEEQDTTHFFQEDSFAHPLGQSMNVGTHEDSQAASGLQRMFATPTAAGSLSSAPSPATIASGQKVLRRSLRIAMQKHHVGDFEVSTLNESGIGLPTLFDEGQSSSSNTESAVETPRNKFSIGRKSLRKGTVSSPGLISLGVSTPKGMFDSPDCRPNRVGLQRLFKTPKGLLAQKALEEAEENSVAESAENEEEKETEPQASPVAVATRKSLRKGTVSSPGLMSLGVSTPKGMFDSPDCRPNRVGLQRLFKTPKGLLAQKALKEAEEISIAESLEEGLQTEQQTLTSSPIKVAARKSLIPVDVAGRKSSVAPSTPIRQARKSVALAPTPSKTATPKCSGQRNSIAFNISPPRQEPSSEGESNVKQTPVSRKNSFAATPVATSPASAASSPAAALQMNKRMSVARNSGVFTPRKSFASSVVTQEDQEEPAKASSTPMAKRTSMTPQATTFSAPSSPFGSPFTKRTSLTPQVTTTSISRKSTSSPATNKTCATPQKTPSASRKSEVLKAEARVSMSSPRKSIASSSASPIRSGTPKGNERDTSLSFSVPETPVAVTPPAANTSKAGGTQRKVFPFYSPTVIKALTGSPFYVKRPIPTEVLEGIRREVRGIPLTPTKEETSFTSSPCLINFDASIAAGRDEEVVSESPTGSPFSVKDTAAKNQSVDLIKLDESKMSTTGCGDTTNSSSVFDMSRVDGGPETTLNSVGTLDDTIELMDRLLAMADEQEKNEHEQREFGNGDVESPKVPPPSPLSNAAASPMKPATPLTRPASVLSSKRVMDLQKKKVFFTPSPTRRPSTGNSTAQKGRKSFVDVKSRVDSNLKGNSPAGVTLGLSSKVADYIYSTAPSAQFVRVAPSPSGTVASSGGKRKPFVVGKATGIPRPSLPFLNSRVPPPNIGRQLPKSASRVAPSSVGTSKAVTAPVSTPRREFKAVTHKSASKLKTANERSFYESRVKENYTGIRHTGNRDESGNASIIQNVSVTKAFIGSRLATPKSYAMKRH